MAEATRVRGSKFSSALTEVVQTAMISNNKRRQDDTIILIALLEIAATLTCGQSQSKINISSQTFDYSQYLEQHCTYVTARKK